MNPSVTVLAALSEGSVALIVVALIAAGAGIVNTVLLRRQRSEMKTGNGVSLGPLVASIADRLFHHETKLDSVDVAVHEVIEKIEEVDTKIVSHIESTRPLVEVFLKEHPELRSHHRPDPRFPKSNSESREVKSWTQAQS